MLHRADTIFREEERITNRQMARCLLIRKGSIIHNIRDLGYSKVCSKWVRRSLTVEQETERKAIFSDLFTRFDLLRDLFTPDY